MRIIKFFIIIAIGAGIYYFVSPQIPPSITIKNLTPVRSYGQNLTLDVTLTNYTAQKKSIYLTSGNLAAATNVYIDYTKQPSSAPLPKERSLAMIELDPFSHKDATLTYALDASVSVVPQIVAGNAKSLNLSQGSHVVTVSIGGYTSNEQRFTVE